MTAKLCLLVCLLGCLVGVARISAQEGHPLSGTWHGTWGPNAKDRTDVTLVMNWDGTLSGILNPGLRAAKLQVLTLDASNWGVHLEADLKDKAGAVSHISADGRIEDVTNPMRSIIGTWTQGSVKGDFKLIRDN